MHVVHHFTEIRSDGGGVPRALLDLARVQADAGLDVTLLTAEGGDLPDDWSVRVVLLEAAKGPLQRLSGEGRRRATEVVAAADVVHLHGLWRPRNSQVSRIARRQCRPVVVSPHGMLNDWGMSQGALRKAVYYRLFEGQTLHHAAALHFASRRERELAAPWLPDTPAFVVPLAVDLEPFRVLSGPRPIEVERPELAADVPGVLMLGRLHPSKRVEILIEAATLLHQRGVDFELWLAGRGEPGYENSLRALLRRRALQGRVRFLGWVDGREKVSLLEHARVFALPTEHENFGLVLFESLLCGTPVVTTRGADTWSELEEGGGAFVVDATPEAFAEALSRLLHDRSTCESMGRRGRAWALRYLDPASLSAQFSKLYRRARESSGAPDGAGSRKC